MNAPPPALPEITGAARRFVAIQTADGGPVRLCVSELGDGPPVLMIHGWPQHAGCWRHVAPLLEDEYRLICPDLRGFGASDAPGGGYDPVTFASDMLALLDALGIDHAHVVGHDWGGAAAFELALRAPERVDRMLVLNTIPPWVSHSLPALRAIPRARYAVALATIGERFVSRLPQRLAVGMRRDVQHGDLFTHADAQAFANDLSKPGSARATQLLYRYYLRAAMRGGAHTDDRLTTPTHFLFATGDMAIAPALLGQVDAHSDDLVLELIHGSGHFICDELPRAVADRARALFGR